MFRRKLKIGQIRKPKKCFKEDPYGNMKVVVTAIIEEEGTCSIIAEDGWCVGGAPIEFVRDKTNFIAQYSTWQEAINSKEFKDDSKNI